MGAALGFSSSDPATWGAFEFYAQGGVGLGVAWPQNQEIPSRPPPGFIQVKRKVPG